MKYINIPLSKIEISQRIPINVWDLKGNLLIKKGGSIESERHKEILHTHDASAIESDHKAWQKSYDRVISGLLRSGLTLDAMSRTLMPTEILDIDYEDALKIEGGWMDLHDGLNSLLHLGSKSNKPFSRIEGIKEKSEQLILENADDCLFSMFQLLPDRSAPYTAKNALLVAIISNLTAKKLDIKDHIKDDLFLSALLMNISISKDQDLMAKQSEPLSETQKNLVRNHPLESALMVAKIGYDDRAVLDIIRWHHHPDDGNSSNFEAKKVLQLVDQFIGSIANRKGREPKSALIAERELIQSTDSHSKRIGTAMATSIGLYPPGTYVKLSNGEVAVVAKRGPKVNTPVAVSILKRDGMPLGEYIGRNTAVNGFEVVSPISPGSINVQVSHEKVKRTASRTASS